MTVPEMPDQGPSERLSFPPLNFRAARQQLIVALIASVVVPLLLGALYGWHTYERAIAVQSARLNQLAWVAESKLTGLLDVSRELATQVGDSYRSADIRGIAARNGTLHARLEALLSAHSEVAALSIVDGRGRVLASSKRLHTGKLLVDMGDLQAVRAAVPNLYISLPQSDGDAGAGYVNVFVPMTTVEGHYDGATVVSVNRDYLAQICHELIVENPAVTVGLYREDGGILIRIPTPRLTAPPSKHALLEHAFARDASRGIMTIDSPLDGIRKLLAYRRAGQYPVYASAGLAITDLVRTWVQEDMAIVLAALLPCVGLWLLIGFSLRRLRAEETSWRNWRREVSRRRSAEASTRQLQRMGALGNLVASVAHDFNNLLMVVTANIEIARRKNYNGLKNEVDAVERASSSARELARRLMSVARRQPLKLEVIHPEQWLVEARPLIQSAVGSKVTLILEVNSDVWTIKVDPSEITSAVINMAVNARDAMPQGGSFVVRCKNFALEHPRFGLQAGQYVEFSCQDTGSGMSPEVARHAFEPLFTTKEAGAGTGLGLAQVLAMAEQAGGKARLETELGKGTTIYVYLPRWSGAATEVGESKQISAAEASRENPTVLLVEDNEEVAAGLMAVLEVLGCSARHEPSGDAALEVLEAGQDFDLVLSDIQMPGACDGIGLVEWIKKHRPNQAVTLMTGYAAHFEKARELGVSVLSKPFNADDLNMLLTGDALSREGP
ncbi:Histidine kinase [Burkholderia sp. 8Y]|uniref:hybrid sensor histidine kinase/response regulator n=1 Tax=Burkholderia sp. 8Y TaxID=2653133 RepID=UPI0012F246BE|nr:hybrid sensor histidine kinase/response regulator [Burkholderia sp. 8Y]VXC85906.1 Histidine kinase [Burkholderia sp. 8Y]